MGGLKKIFYLSTIIAALSLCPYSIADTAANRNQGKIQKDPLEEIVLKASHEECIDPLGKEKIGCYCLIDGNQGKRVLKLRFRNNYSYKDTKFIQSSYLKFHVHEVPNRNGGSGSKVEVLYDGREIGQLVGADEGEWKEIKLDSTSLQKKRDIELIMRIESTDGLAVSLEESKLSPELILNYEK